MPLLILNVIFVITKSAWDFTRKDTDDPHTRNRGKVGEAVERGFEEDRKHRLNITRLNHDL